MPMLVPDIFFVQHSYMCNTPVVTICSIYVAQIMKISASGLICILILWSTCEHVNWRKSNSKSLFISFLIDRNKDFGEKYLPTTPLIQYANIDTLDSKFSASQRWRAALTL
jgi:hypothetical protein